MDCAAYGIMEGPSRGIGQRRSATRAPWRRLTARVGAASAGHQPSSHMCWGPQREKLPPRQRRNCLDALRQRIHSANKDYEHWLEVCVAMIEKRTVFILGAGASCPYGFPTARGLRKEILSHLREPYVDFLGGDLVTAIGPPTMTDIQIGHGKTVLGVFRPIRHGVIDLFLSRNPRFERSERWRSASAFFIAEMKSRFRERVEKSEHDWYFYLVQQTHTRGDTPEDYTPSWQQSHFVRDLQLRPLSRALTCSMSSAFIRGDGQEDKQPMNLAG